MPKLPNVKILLIASFLVSLVLVLFFTLRIKTFENLTFNQPNLVLTSEISDMSVDLNKPGLLRQFINQRAELKGLKQVVLLNTSPYKEVPVENLVINLADTPQIHAKVKNSEGEEVESLGQRYDRETQTMFLDIYISPKLLEGLPKEEKEVMIEAPILGKLEFIAFIMQNRHGRLTGEDLEAQSKRIAQFLNSNERFLEVK